MEKTLTEDIKNQIKQIAKEHYDGIDILKVADLPINDQVHRIYNELPTIYQKLQTRNILPQGTSLDVFMQIVVPRLEKAAQEAHISQSFSGFTSFVN
jgi:hypothetical protein